MMVSLRRLLPDDFALLRDIRLLALQSDPHVFGSSFAREKEYDDAAWTAQLENPDVGIFGIFDDAGIAGMTAVGVARDNLEKNVAVMWGSWLRADLRGQGLSVKMYQARIDWARAHETVQRIVVSHRQSNAASMHANQKHGFVFTHQHPHVWHDGVTEDHVFYELRLDK